MRQRSNFDLIHQGSTDRWRSNWPDAIIQPMELHRYWFEFEGVASPDRGDGVSLDCTLPWACGVTAFTEQDALDQVAALFPDGYVRHQVRRRLEDVDVSDLAAELERRGRSFDFGAPLVRGVWFPHVRNP